MFYSYSNIIFFLILKKDFYFLCGLLFPENNKSSELTVISKKLTKTFKCNLETTCVKQDHLQIENHTINHNHIAIKQE